MIRDVLIHQSKREQKRAKESKRESARGRGEEKTLVTVSGALALKVAPFAEVGFWNTFPQTEYIRLKLECLL